MRASQYGMSHKRSFDGHIQQPFIVFTRFSVFWRHTSSTIVVVLCCCSKMLSLFYDLEKERDRFTKKYLAFFLSSSPSTFYSQLEIEVECPLVRLQIYNSNILCLVLCYLNISLSYISNALSLFISLSPQYNGHVKAREQYKFLLCLSGF